MKATMDARQFSRALEMASKAINRHSPVPDLEQIRVDAAPGRCRLTATNLKQFLAVELPAEGEEFSFLFYNTPAVLKASKFFDGSLSLDYDEAHGELVMICGPRSSRIAVNSAEVYPDFPQEAPKDVYYTNAQTLSRRFDRVKYAMGAPDPARQSLAGVRFIDKRIATLDGYRMAVNTDDTLVVGRPFILPEEAMTLLPLFGGANISVEVGEKWCTLRSQEVQLATRMLEFDRFSLDAAIPPTFKEVYDVDVKQFTDELKYLDALIFKKGRVPVKFSGGKLTASNPNGNYQSSIDLSAPASIDYGFDPKLMLGALSQFKAAGTVTVKVSSPNAPIVLTDGGADLALVLPVNLAKYEAAA